MFMNRDAVNSLWPGDAIWPHGSWVTLVQHVQVMACCLTAPSDYVNKCLLLVWHQENAIKKLSAI